MKQETITIKGVNITSNQPINSYWTVCLEEFLNTTPFPDIDHIHFTLDYFEEESGIMNLTIFFKDTDHPLHVPLDYEDWEFYKYAIEDNLEAAFSDSLILHTDSLILHTNASITTRHSKAMKDNYSTTMLLSLIF